MSTIWLTLGATSGITLFFFIGLYCMARAFGQKNAMSLVYKLIRSTFITFMGMLFEVVVLWNVGSVFGGIFARNLAWVSKPR